MNLTAIPPNVRAALYWCGYVIGVLGQGLTIVWGAVAAASPDVSMPTWLVIASAVLGLLQTQLNLLAGSNVAAGDDMDRSADGLTERAIHDQLEVMRRMSAELTEIKSKVSAGAEAGRNRASRMGRA